MTFSARYGFKPEKAIQIDSMDGALRNSLWNCLHPYFQRLGSKSVPGNTIYNRRNYLYLLAVHIWVNLLRKPGDELEINPKRLHAQLKSYFMGCTWYEAYDFVESVARVSSNSKLPEKEWLSEFVKACNEVLKQEKSGYRFIDKLIVPVTSEHEIAAIQDGLAATNMPTNLALVNTHLKQALAHLADRHTPDYRNSMKESICAVESLCKLIANNPKAELGPALDAIQKTGAQLHPALVDAFKKLYGYTSDADGIRHALKDAPTVDVEDARYMLVMCAGFVSYLIEKARKAGIAL